MAKATLAERIEAKVDRSAGLDACHPWRGNRTSDGYGRASTGSWSNGSRKEVRVSRFVLEQKLGRSLAPGMNALHNCPEGDDPACCNPAHLWEGTQPENVADMRAKGRERHAVGEQSGARRHPEKMARRGDQNGRSANGRAREPEAHPALPAPVPAVAPPGRRRKVAAVT